MPRRILITTLIASTIVLLAFCPADAKKKKSTPCLIPGQCGSAEEVGDYDKSGKALLDKVSHDPSLMNLDYLQYFIGRPGNERTQRGKLSTHYTWMDEDQQLRYELTQQQTTPGSVVDAQMNFHLRGMGLTFETVDKLYGEMSRKYFDFKGHPNKLFTFAPDTYVSFSSPPNTFRVTEAKVMYRGKPLPPPSLSEMQLAQSAMIARASVKHSNGEHDPELITLLQQRVQIDPRDPEAHLHLAQSLHKQARLHEAIGEYKVALALSGSNQDVRMQALDALRAMKLFPPDDEPRRRNLEIVQNGNRMETRGNEKKANGSP